MNNNIDIEELAKGIVNDNEVGSMFFSIVNQKYSSDVSELLCNALRNWVNYDEILDILQNTKADNLTELVTKSCNKILLVVDKIIIKIHNDIKEYTKEV